MTDLVQDMELSRDGKTLTIAAGKEVRSFYLLVAWDPAHPQGCGAGAFLRRSKRPRPFAHPQDADLVLGRGRCVTAPAGRQVHCGMFCCDRVSTQRLIRACAIQGGSDLWVRVFDFETGEMQECHKGHHGPVRCLRYSPGGETFASGSEDGTIRIWQTDPSIFSAVAADSEN